jgi:hypothetical protein
MDDFRAGRRSVKVFDEGGAALGTPVSVISGLSSIGQLIAQIVRKTHSRVQSYLQISTDKM